MQKTMEAVAYLIVREFIVAKMVASYFSLFRVDALGDLDVCHVPTMARCTGEKPAVFFRPFLEYLVARVDLPPKTIQEHVDNLWALGGEIIRDPNETPSLRKKISNRFSSM